MTVTADGSALFTGSDGSLATTPGVVQPDSHGGSDAFLVRISLKNPKPVIQEVVPAAFVLDAANLACPARLWGTGFGYGATVTLNGAPVNSAFYDSSRIDLSMPCESFHPGENRIVVTMPGPGGGSAEQVIAAINGPPAPVAFSPASVVQGAAETKLTIKAANLTASSLLVWNGAQRAASFVPSIVGPPGGGYFELMLGAEELSQPASIPFAVTNPGPGGGTAPAVFVVQPASGAGIPLLNARRPIALKDGKTTRGPLSFTGSGFTPDTKAYWDGVEIPVSSATASEIYVRLPDADLDRWGEHELYAMNGAYRSNTIRVLVGRSLEAVVSAYDRARNRLYAIESSLQSSRCYSGCDLRVIDGATGGTLTTVPDIIVKARPAVALSADGRYLYIAQTDYVSFIATIFRFNTETNAVDLQWQAPSPPSSTGEPVTLLITPPDSPETLIVATYERVMVFDRDRQRPFDSTAAGVGASDFDATRALFASGERIYGGYSGCWKWLDYDYFGISGVSKSCAVELPGAQHDSGVSYYSDGKRTYVLASPSPVGPSAYAVGPSAYALELDVRKAWTLSSTTSNYTSLWKLSQYDMDTGQVQLKPQMIFTDSSLRTPDLYSVGNGAVLAVMSTFVMLVP